MANNRKVYPDHTFENRARAAGAGVRVLWEVPGPANTQIAWMVAYQVDGCVVIVQTYQNDGWDVFSSLNNNSVDDTVEDALARCGVGLAQNAAA